VNGLDPEGIRWTRSLCRDLAAEGRTVLISSHLMAEMARTADQLVLIGKGALSQNSPLTTSSRAVPNSRSKCARPTWIY